MSTAVNPRPFIHDLTGKQVVVRLKWGQEYVGLLVSVDAYMNFMLEGAEEWLDSGKTKAGRVGEMMIRCNNVLYVRERPEGEYTE